MIVKINLTVNDIVLPFELIIDDTSDKEEIINRALSIINSKFNLTGKSRLVREEVRKVEIVE